MKDYPRIHSLSTLGIIHHHDNDYLFHPLRTDFMGDSGCGKSIIADLLQLIFVGSGAFKSSTATVKEKREPNGLAIITPGKGSNIAYAFLNIETAKEKYIVIGTCIESTNKHTRPFIIQASTEIENEELLPIQIPLKTTDFKKGNSICEPEELYELMDEKQLVFKIWERCTTYHSILSKHHILPLNLAASNKKLNDYAKIIQSFSRGKTLDTQKSKSLLDFLFGNEKANELYQKYLEIVKELEANTILHNQNMDTIEQVSRKYKRICILNVLLNDKKQKENDYLITKLLYAYQQRDCLQKSVPANALTIYATFDSIRQLTDAGKKDLSYAQETTRTINEEVEQAFASLQESGLHSKILDSAKKLLSALNISPDLLEEYYQEYQTRKKEYTAYKELHDKLSARKLQEYFEQSEWIKGLKTGNEYYINRIAELQNILEQLDLLSTYTDPDNPQSLVRWAINLNRPLSLIEESMVVHYQTLPRTEPESQLLKGGRRYLPHPEVLFNSPTTEQKENGFWINLNGIKEFITYVPQQRLNTADRNLLEQYFKSQSHNILRKKEQFKKEQATLQDIYSILSELSNAPGSIKTYQEKNKFINFKDIVMLNVPSDTITSYIRCLKEKRNIEKENTQAKEAYNTIHGRQLECNSILSKMPSYLQEANNSLQELESETTFITNILKQYNILLANEYDLSFYHHSEEKTSTFHIELNNLRKELSILPKLHEDTIQLKQLIVEIAKQEEDFQSLDFKLPKKGNTYLQKEDVDKKQRAFIDSESAYNAGFDSIIDDFIPTETHKFEGSNKDFIFLATNLLTDVFREEDIKEEGIAAKVEAYLTSINNKNKELNSKKIKKIETLLNDVETAIGAQMEIIRGINRFFGVGEKKISGNYSVYLSNTSSEIPLTWLSAFKRRAGSELSLFETSISDRVSLAISVKDKIMEAFREITGNNNPDIGLTDLLNPNSYMELSLDMYDTNGKKNKGSSGQTYAAISLLCIARLSVVNRKNNTRLTGLRFMPIDEAEGLGSNFDMLHTIAQKHDYQIITFAINPLGRYDEQFIYILHRDPDAGTTINYTPMAIRSRNDINEELNYLIEE